MLRRLAIALVSFSTFVLHSEAAELTSRWVHPGPEGKLLYQADARGNTVQDFSNCGYAGGGVALPEAAVKVTISPEPGGGDDTRRIQEAIDKIVAVQTNASGIRGAVLLRKGIYRIAGSLNIRAGGVVLRGEGQGTNGTVLVGTGTSQRVLIQVRGSSDTREVNDSKRVITDDYVPVGARSFHVAAGHGFKAGDTVIVRRIGNEDWIHYIKMDQIRVKPGNPNHTRQWEPFDLDFDRVVTAVDGERITVDAPIVCAIERNWGGGEIVKYTDAGRIEQVGIENLRGDSEFDPSITEVRDNKAYPSDERHAMGLVSFARVKNAWVRDLTAVHFYHGVVSVGAGSKWITVQDSSALDPVSKIEGGRRYPFAINGGELVLVQRCYSRGERHAFVFGARVCGPNVFLNCASERDYATSEPHHRWSVGGLYDNAHAHLAFQDRQDMGTGHGWSGANYVAWNCEGSLICQRPPTAQNYAIGFVGKKERGAFPREDGVWESFGTHVAPASLYLSQLQERLGARAVENVGYGSLGSSQQPVPDSTKSK